MGRSFVKGVDCPVKIGGSKNRGEFLCQRCRLKNGGSKNGEVLM